MFHASTDTDVFAPVSEKRCSWLGNEPFQEKRGQPQRPVFGQGIFGSMMNKGLCAKNFTVKFKCSYVHPRHEVGTVDRSTQQVVDHHGAVLFWFWFSLLPERSTDIHFAVDQDPRGLAIQRKGVGPSMNCRSAKRIGGKMPYALTRVAAIHGQPKGTDLINPL